MDSEMIHDFFYAVSYSAFMNLHIKQLDGVNNHHIAESSFKAFGKALDMATMHEERVRLVNQGRIIGGLICKGLIAKGSIKTQTLFQIKEGCTDELVG